MGLVTPDEPRYADIGRAMAQTGDWVMPRLFGSPWYEKPALLCWLIGLGNLIGLGPEWAARLPVALLSVAFLLVFWHSVRRHWTAEIAAYSTGILATSGGWLAYSHVAVTDLPMSVFFGAAVLLSLPWVDTSDRKQLPWAAGCLGLAVLAKGLVPLVLFLPVLAVQWRRCLDWIRPGPALAFCVVALPWYWLCSVRSHGEFLRVFFLEHHFGRFQSAQLQHVQPWWFYLPVVLLLAFPWFPLLPLIRIRSRGSLLVAAVVLFGLMFFSAAVNKLPGYLLPLLPMLAILLGEAAADAKAWRLPLAICLGMAGLLPLAVIVLPGALAHGLRSTPIPWIWLLGVPLGLLAGAIVSRQPRFGALSLAFSMVALCFAGFEWIAFPRVDAVASARPIWHAQHPTCLKDVSRSIAYGLQYYAGRPLPECTLLDQAKPHVVR